MSSPSRATRQSRPGRGAHAVRHHRRARGGIQRRRLVALVAAVVLPLPTTLQLSALAGGAQAAPAPTGAGFTVTPGDLGFILKQIKIAERHATTMTASNPCGTLVARSGDGIPDAEQVPDILTAYGLRTVDGSCNNLKNASTASFAAADQPFPRLTTPKFRDADPITPDFPIGAPRDTSYKDKLRSVVDAQPRTISNLIVDQTSTNPAAVSVAGHPVRSQNPTASAVPCTVDPGPDQPGDPVNCTPSHHTLFIPNVTTDVGLSPPFNSLFTFFGQFFDHGVDQTVKSGPSVFVPLKPDDPLITLGPDGKPNTGDEVNPARGNGFMVLTRAQNQPGDDKVLGTADDVQDASNTDTPWVDQSQTYTSHASHQVFLRAYAAGTGTAGPDNPAAVATGELLTGLPAGQTYPGSPDGTGGESTWAAVKDQAAKLLGLKLTDRDVTNVPMLATDPYGKYLPGPDRGLPQYVTTGPDRALGTADDKLVEGNVASPVPVPADVVHFDTPFLTDIAHNADPSQVDTNHDGRPDAWPTPDDDTTVQTDFSKQPTGTYDDELLNSHAACGDGRCNENIALTSIHQVFHSEHNRLVADIRNTLESDTSAAGQATLAAWQATGVAGARGTGSYGYGERLFQAARYVTEMEYQHLVFEEFARKVQPAVRPFHVYSPDINPAVEAEFAHAVYRFGHSMLDDDVARTNVDPTTGAQSDNSIPLLQAFLNPPELFNGGSAGTLSAAAGAGSVLMGSSDQTGNEIDEFVTETLRNNLLGLPLDLAAINMARAREAGVPPLNDVRRQLFADTNDGQLTPYTSWSDFGQHLKHPESLVNFVAAYGLHPTITAATTLKGKRDAARAIVDPGPNDVAPLDAADFMFSTGTWGSGPNGLTKTGLDDVDLWVGGLAEVTNLFGGMLGSTFNYVFQTQLEKLQDGDRLYYLARTPGMNLRSQLESNSFSEMIQRNTDGTDTLKSDAFARADCKFQLKNLGGTAAAFTASGSSVADDPSTPDCDENALLLRKPDGTIQYRAMNSVDPPGINGQAVYQGTGGPDRVFGGNDNDTFWGGKGNDVIEGNGGDDTALGGEGDDIITDLSGADVPKGGPGNDAIDGGIGDDIVHGNDGKDFLNGGANDNETFAGEGDDFLIAGQGADAVFGDGGDDWIEGGSGQDLLQGDHGAPFFDDPAETAPGNEVMIGQVGENDYDAEGGDDLMSQNAAIDRNAGGGGYDWAFHQFDTTPADDDLMVNNNLGGLPIQVIVNRDRWQETEAVSGGSANDTIRGTDGVLGTPRFVTGGGFSGCDAIDAAGLDRIKDLDHVLPPISSWVGDAADVAGTSPTGTCPLKGKVWGEGDILIGGPGSDTFAGRSGDDVIDGDKELRVSISVRDAADHSKEIGSTDLMEGKALSGGFGPGTAGMTLQAAVFAGLVDPDQLVATRAIEDHVTAPADCAAAAPKNCDVVTYPGPSDQYVVTPNADGSLTVEDTTSTAPAPGAPARGDGTDLLRNVEELKFNDQVGPTTPPGAPRTVTASAIDPDVSVDWTAPVPNGSAAVTGYDITVKDAADGTTVRTIAGVSPTAFNHIVSDLPPSRTYTFTVQAVNDFGAGPGVASNPVTLAGPPEAPTSLVAVASSKTSATLTWVPGGDGGLPLVDYMVTVWSDGAVVDTLTQIPATETGFTVTGLVTGQTYTFDVQATNPYGPGAPATSDPLTLGVVPAAPTGLRATAGNASARLAWTPGDDGGSAITGYELTVRAGATVVRTQHLTGAVRSTVVTGLTNGRAYSFRLQAVSSRGTGALSAPSNTVTPATRPGQTRILAPARGAAGGLLTAVARWNAPLSTGGASITSYRVTALRMARNGSVAASRTVTVSGSARSRSFTLAAASYRFIVVAVNSVGSGPASARSALVTPR